MQVELNKLEQILRKVERRAAVSQYDIRWAIQLVQKLKQQNHEKTRRSAGMASDN